MIFVENILGKENTKDFFKIIYLFILGCKGP